MLPPVFHLPLIIASALLLGALIYLLSEVRHHRGELIAAKEHAEEQASRLKEALEAQKAESEAKLCAERQTSADKLAALEQSFRSQLNFITGELDKSRQTTSQRESTIAALNQKLSETTSLLASTEAQAQALRDQSSDLTDLLKRRDNEIAELIEAREDLSVKNQQLLTENRYAQELTSRLRTEQQSSLEALRSELKIMGESMLKERTAELNQNSKAQFEALFAPLKNDLKTFQSLITGNQKIQSEQTGALLNELNRLQETHLAVSAQSEELIKALRGGRKSQGMWGEHQLELCLEAAGLKEGFDYDREVAAEGAAGQKGRPDVILHLPKKHCLIIDAKCSLTAYTNYINADIPEDSQRFLKEHLASVKAHINELASKRYDHFADFNSPSFVFMFVPVDGALDLALASDANLYTAAQKGGVYLVSPGTLIPALKVVSNLWILATQNERIARIAKEAESIYKKAQSMTSQAEKLFNQYQSLGRSLSDFMGAFKGGRGSLLSQLEKFSAQRQAIAEELNLPQNNISESQQEKLLQPEPEIPTVKTLINPEARPAALSHLPAPANGFE